MMLNYDFCIGEIPGPFDVLAGRGGKSGNHPANKDYLARVDAVALDYAAASSRKEKNVIKKAIIEHVHHRGGRFVGRCQRNGLYYLLDPKSCGTKASSFLVGFEGRPDLMVVTHTIVFRSARGCETQLIGCRRK